MFAAENGHTEVVKQLLAKGGIEVNQTDNHGGNSALMFATYYGHTQIVEQLLLAGAQLHSHIKKQITQPIKTAIQKILGCNSLTDDQLNSLLKHMKQGSPLLVALMKTTNDKTLVLALSLIHI